MFNHVMLGSNDLEASKKFYDALIGSMGGKPGRSDPMGAAGLCPRWRRADGEQADQRRTGVRGQWRDAGVQGQWAGAGAGLGTRPGSRMGGTTCEDPPGERAGSNGPIYLAYLRDPDGNKLCAVHRMAK